MKNCISVFFIVCCLSFLDVSQTSACTMTITNINFGTYNVFSTQHLDTTGNVRVDCASNVNKITVSLGPSPNSGGFNPRQMRRSQGTGLMNYNIFTNASRTIIWGNGTGGTSTQTANRPGGKPQPWSSSFIAYGRIFSRQDVSVGSYGETIVVTVIY